uniref:Uncharacterized protein n=1 Tax=Anguilla anguilla TaxID=7936 RepID=A0A0E9U650_ANGAN
MHFLCISTGNYFCLQHHHQVANVSTQNHMWQLTLQLWHS